MALTKHGHRRLVDGKPIHTPEYSAWGNAISRCEAKSYPSYAQYGGRGIKMCPRWRGSFEAFYSDMGSRPNGMTLDRIDIDKDYEPSNCRWASMRDQVRNRRNVRWTWLNGNRVCIADLRRHFGLSRSKALKLADMLDLGVSDAFS